MFSIALKELRENKKLSQKQLAADLHISQSTVGMWESGKREPNFEMLTKLAEYFNVSTDYLIGNLDTPTPKTLDEQFLFYDIYKSLCLKNGETVSRVAEKLNIQKSNVTAWKNGGVPRADVLMNIAEYFGCSVDYLLGRDQEQEKSLDKQLDSIEFALFGEVKELTEEQKRDILNYARFLKSQDRDIK